VTHVSEFPTTCGAILLIIELAPFLEDEDKDIESKTHPAHNHRSLVSDTARLRPVRGERCAWYSGIPELFTQINDKWQINAAE